MSAFRGDILFISLFIFSLFAAAANARNVGTFVVLSDVHYGPELGNQASPSIADVAFGDDSPFWLVNSSIYAMAQFVPNPDFILISGDLVAHSLSSENSSYALVYGAEVLSTISEIFAKAYNTTNKYVSSPITALGNNDLYPKYAAPNTTASWFQMFADNWPSLNYDTTEQQSFLGGGSYTIDIPIPGSSLGSIRIIVLHTNYWSSSNTLTANDADPGGVLAFLTNQLSSAQTSGKKVYILGHIPPGMDHYAQSPQWQARFITEYLNIVLPYVGSTVLGQFYGHEHVSLFRLFGQLSPQQANTMNLAGPVHLQTSISPVYDNYPGFRAYSYDRDTLDLIDFAAWYLPFESSSDWQVQFTSMKAEFGLPDFGIDGFCSFVQNMYTNNTLVDSYITNSYSAAPDETACTTEQCRLVIICNAQFLTPGDYAACTNGTALKLSCGGSVSNDGDKRRAYVGSFVLMFLVTLIF